MNNMPQHMHARHSVLEPRRYVNFGTAAGGVVTLPRYQHANSIFSGMDGEQSKGPRTPSHLATAKHSSQVKMCSDPCVPRPASPGAASGGCELQVANGQGDVPSVPE